MEQKEINRVSNPNQFLVNLQLEYLTQRLRSLIYLEDTYAKVAADIAQRKKMKIAQLGAKFDVPTIFSGLDIEEFIDTYFWSKYGLPNLRYKDAQQRRVQGNYDRWYLLYRGTSVLYKGQIVEVTSNNPAKEEVEIRKNDSKFIVNYNDITLIKNNYTWI